MPHFAVVLKVFHRGSVQDDARQAQAEGGYHQSSKRTVSRKEDLIHRLTLWTPTTSLKWLLVLIRQHGGVVAAKKAGVDEALIRRHAYPKKDSENVTLTLVDRVVTAMGSHLS